MPQQACHWERVIQKPKQLDYLLSLPAGYDGDADQRWPLIVFLHGAGERGNDVLKVKAHGLPNAIERGDDLPFVTVSPQCPSDANWPLQFDALDALIDEVMATHAIDRDRVYLTGLSLGGNGTWHFAAAFPDRFAAIVPICGWGEWWAGFPDAVCRLKHVPVWAFHGAKDAIVPLARSQELVNKLEECGGNVRFTVYPDADHNSWAATYDNPELYHWLLGQHLSDRAGS